MNTKLILNVLILLALVYAAIVYLDRDKTKQLQTTVPSTTQATTTEEAVMPTQTIEEYVKANISTLSPEKEVLGGTYYVTKLETGNNKGTVWYEDGHNAYVADFSYVINKNGTYEISAFTIR